MGGRLKISRMVSVVLVVFLAALLAACGDGGGGGGGSGAAAQTGVTAVGTTNTPSVASLDLKRNSYFAFLASKVHTAAWTEVDIGGETAYDQRLTPQGYSVGLQYVKLLLDDGDTTPDYTVFDEGALSNSPQVIDLVTAQVSTLGTNSAYPASGDYNRCQYLLVYVEMTFPMDGTAETVRLYMSTVGTNQNGDVKLFDDTETDPALQWKWIDSTKIPTDPDFLTTTRPGLPVMLDLDGGGMSDPFVQIDSLTAPFTFPASPSGQYKITFTFDVANTFFWDDCNNNQQFEYAIDGHFTCYEPGDPDHEFHWWPGPPAITAEFSTS